MNKSHIFLIIISILTLLSIISFFIVFFYGGYCNKILAKFGLSTLKAEKSWAVLAWDGCLKKLHYDAEIAFIGDSLTSGGNFQDYFPDRKIINLGYGGDTIVGVTQRVSMLKNTTPEKIFLLVGINGLTNFNGDISLESYSNLLSAIKEAVPDAQVYVQSLLPISNEKTKELMCSNDTIVKFNESIKNLTEQNQMTYIDLFSKFEENNYMKADLTVDGIHINSKGYDVWTDTIADYIN